MKHHEKALGVLAVWVVVSALAAPADAACPTRRAENPLKRVTGVELDGHDASEFCFDVHMAPNALEAYRENATGQVSGMIHGEVDQTIANLAQAADTLGDIRRRDLDSVQVTIIHAYADSNSRIGDSRIAEVPCEPPNPRSQCIQVKAGTSRDDIYNFFVVGQVFGKTTGFWSDDPGHHAMIFDGTQASFLTTDASGFSVGGGGRISVRAASGR